MYSVSLLPSEYRSRIKSVRQKNIVLLTLLAIACALTAAFTVLHVFSIRQDHELESIKNRNAILEKQITKLADLENMNSEASSLLTKALAAYGTNPDWDSFISALGNSVPDSIGLTSLNMKYADGADECVVQGNSRDNQSVYAWMKALKELPGVGEINYKFSSNIEGDLIGTIQFELNLTLSPGAGYRIPLKEGGDE